MQASMLLQRVVHWRWAPCLGLIAASLSFVLLAIALIPRDFGPVGAGPLLASGADPEAADRVNAMPTDPGGSLRRLGGRTLSQAMRPPARPLPRSAVVGGIFHSTPPMELPVAPPDPNPDPPPPEPPPPAPSSTIFELPTPPLPAVDEGSAVEPPPPEPAVADAGLQGPEGAQQPAQ